MDYLIENYKFIVWKATPETSDPKLKKEIEDYYKSGFRFAN